MKSSRCPGFDDLFRAAEGRGMTTSEAFEFSQLTQAEKNETVKRLVLQTKGAFTYEDVVGTDGQLYTSFTIT
jgi:hypothetical protein